jgi:hypothetical protein
LFPLQNSLLADFQGVRNADACRRGSLLLTNSDTHSVTAWIACLPDGFSSKKISLLVNFGGPLNGSSYIFWPFGIFYEAFGICYDHLVHFVSIWYIFPVLVSCTKKNLATLLDRCLVQQFVGKTIGGFNHGKGP